MRMFVRSLVSSRWLVAIAGLSVFAGSAVTRAEEPETWSMSREELQAVGLGQSRGLPVPVPTDATRLRSPTEPKAHATPGLVFVNFDGAQLTTGSDDAINNVTQIPNLAGAFAAYGEGAKREAVMQALFTDWAAYDVTITDARPASGPYTMNMTGPTNPFGGGVLGIAPLDCFDSQTHSNITYAFHSVNDQFSAAVQATTVSQEVAHSYGLEHVDEPGDIMNPYNAGGDASFIDACIPIVTGGQPIVCGQQHAEHCEGGGTSQNAHLELLDLFGTSVPDTAAPVVAISYPSDGDMFEVGASFEIMVEASDDVGVDSVQLFNNGTPLQVDADEPYGWEVNDIPEGVYEMYVVAADRAGNETTSATITISVGDVSIGGSSSGGDSDDDGPGPSSATDGDTDGTGQDGGGEGCGCRSRQAPAPGWLLLIGLLGLVRRRRGDSLPPA